MNQDIEILRILAKYDKRIEKLYNKLLYQLSKVSLNITKIREGAFFSFDDYPEIKEQVNEVLNSYNKEQQDTIVQGINQAMKKSFDVNKAQFGEYSKYSNQAITDMRKTAAEAFIESRMKPKEGLSLSQKVWNYTQQAKSEFEAGISEILEEGLFEGTSAEELGRKLRNKLKYPDMVYKRYHLKKMTAKGKKDVVEWRRKVVDSEGKVRYVKEDLEKVGRGVYRSSRKNALRLTATEINMAYRYADYVRWNSEPFVIGFRIQLSGNHTCNGKPFYDMCDDLVGVYPKTFKWLSWHPRCRCVATPILVNKEEMEKISDLPDNEYRNYRSLNLVKKMPKVYDEYVEKEKDRILASMDRGTTPYWVRDNYKSGDIRKKFVWERIGKTKFKTQTQKDVIQKAWDERRRRNAIEAARVKRHANRDALAIQEAWDLRKEKYAKIMKTAQNVNMAAYGEPWVDRTNLKWLINKKKYHLLEAEYRKVAKELSLANKRKKQLSTLIPDIDGWSQQYSYEELKAVFDGIEKRLARESTELHARKKFLESEIKWVEAHKKYNTWKVALDAYKKELSRVEYKIAVEEVYESVKDAMGYAATTRSAALKKLAKEMQDILSKDNVDLTQARLKAVQLADKYKALLKDKSYYAKTKLPKGENVGKETIEMLKARLGEKFPKTLSNLEKAIAQYEKGYNYGDIAKKFKAEIEEVMRELFDRHDLGMNIKDSNLELVLNSWFKNTFETGSSGGYLGSLSTSGKIDSSHSRLRAAHKLFGIGSDLSRDQLPRAAYEKYGNLLEHDILKSMKTNTAKGYGNVEVRFKKDKVIATWTAGDSLCCTYQPSLVSDPRSCSFDALYKTPKGKVQTKDLYKFKQDHISSYLELQFHGDLTIDCVESLTFPYNLYSSPYLRVAKEWKKRGVDIYFIDGDNLLQL